MTRLAPQSIHITTSPSPRTLAESRLILAALQRFGEVVTFRNLKYDTTNTNKTTTQTGTTLAIFDSPTAAQTALQASPIQVPINPTSSPVSSRPGVSSPQAEPEQTTLTCTLQPSRHNHESSLRRNPFHTAFRVEERCAQHVDLMRNTGVPLAALADEPGPRKRGESGRVKRAVMGEVERLGGVSLLGLYREGLDSSGNGSGRGVEGDDPASF
ncbi:hypothetical protein P168DRAFT_326680 [Aspergillus campestris IBT 28561]|uniref:Uncharacterized protein n=1 Tax=Aspergillus campestris (strain IBT 28561) TaxID=1392248 RepID=A0A2I1D4Y1_ASPC2|nr:uncharacterized protein P168DRAFT_326680 [Aspergillus campestris IBT 28561]PKY04923.1 hypothetical protein P168DRAFT_326680 [Aspergillus campestris IBT 28561]